MNRRKKKKLEAAGWKFGSPAEFLDLSNEDVAIIEIKLALGASVRGRRKRRGLTQEELAERMGSSQSRVAKMEASDPSVSIDLLVRGLLALGVSTRGVAEVMASAA